MTLPDDRLYAPPLRARRTTFLLYAVGVWVIGFSVIARAPWWSFVISGGFLAFVVWGAEIGLRRRGVHESPAGITGTTLMWGGFQTTPWNEIDEFREGPAKRVYVAETSGRTWLLIGVVPGARTRWNGGETDDIVGELNRRLALWQAAGDSNRTLDEAR